MRTAVWCFIGTSRSNLMVTFTNAFVSANTVKLHTCCGHILYASSILSLRKCLQMPWLYCIARLHIVVTGQFSGLSLFPPTSPVSEYTLDLSGSFGTWKSLWFPFLLKRSIFDVWAVPVKVPWLLSLSGLSRSLRSSYVSPDQFRGPTNLWAGNRNEQIHVLRKKKKNT